jgi:hypothetical protein
MAQLKPLTVMINDVLAHTFWKVQHMATVHYENGHYHLHTELKTISEESNDSTQEKVPDSEKSNEDTSNQIVHEFNYDFATNSILFTGVVMTDQDVLNGYLNISAPPPKA